MTGIKAIQSRVRAAAVVTAHVPAERDEFPVPLIPIPYVFCLVAKQAAEPNDLSSAG